MIGSAVSTYESVQLFRFVVRQLGMEIKPVYCFLVDGLLIDTGMSKAANAVCKRLDAQPPQQLVLTHHHPDHAGNVALLQSRYDIPAYAHPLCLPIVAAAIPGLFYQRLIFGKIPPCQLIPIPAQVLTDKHRFEVFHTPGHALDQVSLFERERGWLFSGDLFVAKKVKYFKRDEVLLEQIHSIEKLLTLDFETLFCCHNPQLQNGKAALVAKLNYLKNYYEQVAYFHQKGYAAPAIFQAMKLRENHLWNFFTNGDVSAMNMIRSALRTL